MTTPLVIIPKIELFSSGELILPTTSILSTAKSKFWIFPKTKDMGADCGYDVPKYCQDCVKTFTVKHKCMKRECLRCGISWQYVEGRKAAFRLWTGRISKYGLNRGRLLHITVSPPQESVPEVLSKSCVRKLRNDCYKLCKRHGIVGGCVFIHPTRSGKDGLHFHINGYAPGDILPGGADEDKGWIFKIIRDAKRKDYKGFKRVREIVRCIGYELGHSGLSEGLHGISWFGEIAYNNLNQQVLELTFTSLHLDLIGLPGGCCPYCGSRNIQLAMNSDWDSGDVCMTYDYG